MGLHALFVYDETGTCLLPYTRASLVDGDLFTGMSAALGSFFEESMGGSPQKVELSNGLLVRYSQLRIQEYTRVNAFLNLDSASKEFRYHGQKRDLINLMEYFGNGKQDFEGEIMDDERNLHSFKFKYESEYKIVVGEKQGQELKYKMIYDMKDEELEFMNGNKLVDTYFTRFEKIIIDNLQLLGKVMATGKTDDLMREASPDLFELFNDYQDDRQTIIETNPYPIIYNNVSPEIFGIESAIPFFNAEIHRIINLYFYKHVGETKEGYDNFLDNLIGFLQSTQAFGKPEPITIIEELEREVSLPSMPDELANKMKNALELLKEKLK